MATRTGSPLGRVSNPFTKSMLMTTLSERTGLTKKDVVAVIDELSTVIAGHLKKGGPEVFTLPGLLKMKVKRVPARPAKKGVSPFTGEPMVFKAKPASRRVVVRALSSLKDMAS